jgi:membrane protein implicated in regulation of membrane protease activity
MEAWEWWLGGALLLLGAEMATGAFFALFLSVAAVASSVTSRTTAPVSVQMMVFAFVAVVGVILGRPPLLRWSRERRNVVLPGVQGLIGQMATAVESIGDTHHPGHVALAGERWLAVSDSGTIAGGQTVVVVDVRGTTLAVSAVGPPGALPSAAPPATPA